MTPEKSRARLMCLVEPLQMNQLRVKWGREGKHLLLQAVRGSDRTWWWLQWQWKTHEVTSLGQAHSGHSFGETLNWWPCKRPLVSLLDSGWPVSWLAHLRHRQEAWREVSCSSVSDCGSFRLWVPLFKGSYTWVGKHRACQYRPCGFDFGFTSCWLYVFGQVT